MKEVMAHTPKEPSLWVCFTCPNEQKLEKQKEKTEDDNHIFTVYKCSICGEIQIDPVKEKR